MQRIQPSRNRGDLFTIGREHTLGHRLPVKFACGAGDGWRVLWAWLDRAGEEEQRLLGRFAEGQLLRSEEHTSELQSLMRISYAVFCLKTKNTNQLITIQYRYCIIIP